MASISQLVSELSHAIGQPNNYALRENLKLLIVHTRNELIRRSYENHSYIDKGLTQRYKVSLQEITDGEIELPEDSKLTLDDLGLTNIKRTVQKVPRPIRLTNNLPFDRVSSVGFKTNKIIPFIKEGSARFRDYLPGMCSTSCYDYINGYIYIFPPTNRTFDAGKICIESAFEHPNIIEIENGEIDSIDAEIGDNEWLIPEDMIGNIKDIIYKRDLISNIRNTNEVPNEIKF